MSKRELGSYYTKGNPFVYRAFREWFQPTGTILEPFAGDGQIPRLVREAGFRARWARYDVDETLADVVHQDTLDDFPQGFQTTITNPPYLSYHFARRKKLPVSKAYFAGYTSLYFRAIEEALESCERVAMIIPESFLTSGRFRERLCHFVSLPEDMFDDTEMPTALVLWGDAPTDDFLVWRQDELLGQYNKLAAGLKPTPCASRIRFNVANGQIGLRAIDNTREASIAFCPPEEIAAEKIKPSARLVSRIHIKKLRDPDRVIKEANRELHAWREQTEDVLLTAFKGVREDGRFRRRLDFGNARALLSHAICRAENCNHNS
jgi:hypothetical protein